MSGRTWRTFAHSNAEEDSTSKAQSVACVQTCIHIPGPKFSRQGLGFSPDGATMALLEVGTMLPVLCAAPCSYGLWNVLLSRSR